MGLDAIQDYDTMEVILVRGKTWKQVLSEIVYVAYFRTVSNPSAEAILKAWHAQVWKEMFKHG